MKKEDIKSDKFTRKTTWSVIATVALFFSIVFPHLCTAISVNDIAENATSLKGNSLFLGTFHGSNDVDYFKIKLPEDGRLQVWTYSNADTKGIVEDEHYRIAEDDNSGPRNNFFISRHLKAGIYYISVSAYDCGSGEIYALICSFKPRANRDYAEYEEAGLVQAAEVLEISARDFQKLVEVSKEENEIWETVIEDLLSEIQKSIEAFFENLRWLNDTPPINSTDK